MRFMRTHTTAIALALTAGLALFSGCETILIPPVPDALPNLTLEQLAEIQGDERLTTDEKRDQIRAIAEIPNDAAGDRLVEFLLTLPTS